MHTNTTLTLLAMVVTCKPHLPDFDKLTMAEVLNRSPLSLAASLPLGTPVSCTTTLGDVLRGNIIAMDATTKALVISILS